MRQVAKLALAVAAVGALGILVWEGRGHHSAAPTESGSKLDALPHEVHEAASPNPKSTGAVTPESGGIRERLKESRDYAALVRSIAGAASSGDHEAEYATAAALKYCDDNLRRFFRKPAGGVRSLPEAQSKWANRPEGYRQEIGEIYERCHGFLDDENAQSATASYSLWLDRAAAANYPPAVAEKADLNRMSELLASATATASGKAAAAPDPSGESRAVWAATSGDPDALFLMQNWVSSDAHVGDDYENVVSAWRLVACQHGYDCEKDSDWMKSQCSFDPQCANDRSFDDYLRRQLADRYETVSDLAEKINAALAAKDPVAVRALL